MRNIKRISLTLIMVVLVAMLSGCIDFQVDLELNKDNTGKITSMSAVDIDMDDGSEGSMTTGIEGLPVELKGVNVERTPLNYKKGESTYEGEKVVISFNNTDEFFKEMSKDEQQTLRILDLPNGNKKLEIIGVHDESTIDFNVFEIISGLGGNMKFTLTTDYNVVGHNATSFQNGIYTWDLLELMKDTNKQDMTAFLEYTPGSRETVPPKQTVPDIKGKSRIEIEKMFNLEPTSKDFHGNALSKLGILKGTEKGLELNEGLTRAQGATMYARLLGLESAIEKWAKENPNYKSPFKDLPSWVKSTVDYLHANNLVKGVSDTEYGSSNMMSVNDFTTLVLRALGYNDSSGDFQWNSAGKKTEEIGLYSDDAIQPANILGSKNFTRGSMSYVSYNALFFKNLKTGQKLIDNLKD